MKNRLPKFSWLDLVFLIGIVGFFYYVSLQIETNLRYNWNWGMIPNYILRWDDETGRWVSNILLQGFLTTIRISIYGSILALVLGTILGLARVSNNLAVRMLARTYVELLRNVPAIVIIFIFHFFLADQIMPVFGVEDWARNIPEENLPLYEFLFGEMRLFPSLLSGIIVISLFESAFVGEIIRSGIESIEKGQWEAGEAIGLGKLEQMRYVILPQAFRRGLPPLANQFITLIKDSSIISLISIQELTYKTSELVATTRAIFEPWLTTAGVDVIIWGSLAMRGRRRERRTGNAQS